MNNPPRFEVAGFLQEARAAAGGHVPQLADALAPILGHRPSDKTVRAWLRGDRTPDTYTLMAMVLAFREQGLSLDKIALADGADQRPLRVQIEELRRRVVALQAALNEDRANRGLEPLKFEEAG